MYLDKNPFPVGTVIQSMLSLAQFQGLMGVGWVLMNGQSCTGSTYASITGATTVPDARGTVLRCKDYGVGRNSSGDTALGTYQDDAFQDHQHVSTYDFGDEGGTSRNQGSSAGTRNWNSRTSLASQSGSGKTASETRVKNITVNFFIKIN